MSTFVKDPDAVLDYQVDWTDWLGTDTITESTWVIDDNDLVIDSDTNTTKITTIWLSEGVAGVKYTLTNSITTTADRKDDRSFTVKVIER